MNAKQITVRNVPPELGRRLKALARSRGESINSTVLYLLKRALDVNERRDHLRRYVSWSDADRREFDEALGLQRTVDDDLWK